MAVSPNPSLVRAAGAAAQLQPVRPPTMRPENRDKEVPAERFLAENRSRRFKALRDGSASTDIPVPGAGPQEAGNAVSNNSMQRSALRVQPDLTRWWVLGGSRFGN